MQIRKLLKKILVAGASAGSALVIAACYGAYYGPQRAIRGPVIHASNPGNNGICLPVSDPRGGKCRSANELSAAERAGLANAIENVPAKQVPGPVAVVKKPSPR